MVDFSSIAIFMLGTTVKNSRFSQPQPTYYESRIIPIYETWSSFFPHVYYVFGTNWHDYKFLQEHRCQLKQAEGSSTEEGLSPLLVDFHTTTTTTTPVVPTHHKKKRSDHNQGRRRRLKANTRQIPSTNATYLYWCSVEGKHRKYAPSTTTTTTTTSSMSPLSDMRTKMYQWFDQHILHHEAVEAGHPISTNHTTTEPTHHSSMQDMVFKSHQHHLTLQTSSRPLQILLTGNCTGEYFGIGPTCRCQETMRYFYRHMNTTFKHVQWFLFMDDDMYFRPYSLLSMLRHVERNDTIGRNQVFTTGQTLALVGAATFHGNQLKAKLTSDPKVMQTCMIVLEMGYSFAQPAIINK